MRIDVLTLFPNMFRPLDESIIGRAKDKGIYTIYYHNIRDYAANKHKKVDDYPYGGGQGMVLMCQPVIDCILEVKKYNKGPVIFLGPKGKIFNQKVAKELSTLKEFIVLCGHYEGIDERIYDYIDMEISLGDFILTGGEIAALAIIDSVLRLIPGVLGSFESSLEESFSNDALEYPQYTRPEDYKGKQVPKVLLSGHHENIRKWRRYMSLEKTKKLRPDLFKKITLNKEDKKIIDKIHEISLGEIKGGD